MPTLSSFYGLIKYGNSNFAGDLKTRTSVKEYRFFLDEAFVLWSSKKQSIVLMFTTETNYIAINHVMREDVWIKRFINKLLFKIIKLSLKSDNKTSLKLIKNLVS